MAETTERHLTEDDLATIATGASPGARAAAHLLTCAACREDLDRTERVVAALAAPVELHEPPAGVWDAIERELGAPGQDASAPPDPHAPGSGPGASAAGPHAGPAAPAPGPTLRPLSEEEAPHRGFGADGTGQGGSVSFLPRRGRRRWPVIAAAAAAGLVVGAAGAGLVTGALTGGGDGDGTPPAGPVAVGEAVLDPVTDRDVAGRAEMVSEPDGALRLTVDVTALPEQGYYEVWLRDEQASRLISLGTVSGASTTLPVPAGVDLERFPVVDVSQEDFDGDPSHSGVTLAAGAMTRAGDTTTG